MKILITGAGGYIGSIATYLLLQKGYEVVAVDNFTRGYRQPLEYLQNKYSEDKLRFYQCDISNIRPVLEKEHNIDAVLHYAALCLVSESMEEPYKYFNNNTCGTLELLNALNEHNIKKIVFSSTCAVYGNPETMPITEDTTTVPMNPYGESKLLTEKIIKWYGERYGFSYIVFRYFNICGASDDGIIGDSKKPSQLLLQNAVRGALKIEPFALTCPEVDTPDKTPIRDYINVVDLNEAHLKGLEYLTSGGKSETINLGTGKGSSVLDIVNTVQEITGAKFEINKAAPRLGEYPRAIAAYDKARTILGWEPKRSIKQSIESLVTWYTAHPHGWDK
jgi:UDP-glucose 4-epimerase